MSTGQTSVASEARAKEKVSLNKVFAVVILGLQVCLGVIAGMGLEVMNRNAREIAKHVEESKVMFGAFEGRIDDLENFKIQGGRYTKDDALNHDQEHLGQERRQANEVRLIWQEIGRLPTTFPPQHFEKRVDAIDVAIHDLSGAVAEVNERLARIERNGSR